MGETTLHISHKNGTKENLDVNIHNFINECEKSRNNILMFL